MTQKAIAILVGDKKIVLPLAKVTAVKIMKPVFHLDELSPSQWRLTYNANTIPDIRQLMSLDFHGMESAHERYTKGATFSFEGIGKGGILSRLTPTSNPKGMIHLDGDFVTGEWKFIFPTRIIHDISQLKSFVIER